MDVTAILFVLALAGSAIVGFVFALFASHAYLMVLQSTGAGSRGVVWTQETVVEFFWELFYLAWLVGLWLIPAWLVSRAVVRPSDATWLRVAVPLAVFGVCYPVSQLCSLGGPSIWLPLHPEVLGRLARKPHLVVGFLALSAAALAALAFGVYWAVVVPELAGLFVGVPVAVAALLVYARLLGRLGFALLFTRSLLARRKKRTRRSAERPDRGTRAEESESFDGGAAHTQPSDLPPIDTPDEGPLHGYDVVFADEPPRPRKRHRATVVGSESDLPSDAAGGRASRPPRDDDDDAAYGVGAPEVAPDERLPAAVMTPSADELRLYGRADSPRRPRTVWSRDDFTFLVQPGTVVSMLVLSVMGVACGGLVRLARAYYPA